MKRVLLYGMVGGALLALLQYIEYQHFVRAYPGEVYGGLSGPAPSPSGPPGR